MVQPGAVPAVAGPARTSALAIVSMVLGIVGATVALCLAPVTIVMGITALVLGLIALGKIRRHPALRGRGFAIAGVSLGSADLLLGGLMMVVFLQAISSAMENAKITSCSNNQNQLMNPQPSPDREDFARKDIQLLERNP